MHELASELNKEGILTESLHGKQKQEVKDRSLASFKAGKCKVLVVTDALARAIDRFLTTDSPGSGFRPAFVDGVMTGTGTGKGCLDPDLGSPEEVLVAYTTREYAALADADVINLLRIQHERQRKSMFPNIGEYASLFGLTRARLAKTKPDAIIMHPGPMNRGVEIESEIADGARAVILEQVTNGIAIRMAVLYLVNGGNAAATKA